MAAAAAELGSDNDDNADASSAGTGVAARDGAAVCASAVLKIRQRSSSW